MTNKEELLGTLTTDQRNAVIYFNKPLQIIAGPGTGKTRVLTHKVAYLIEILNKDPKEVLMITFTVKAAEEMKRRIAKLVKKDISSMFVGTIDSFCENMLNQYGSQKDFSNFQILDDFKRFIYVKKNLKQIFNVELLDEEDFKSFFVRQRNRFILELIRFYDLLTQNLLNSQKLMKLLDDNEWLENTIVRLLKKKSKNDYVDLEQIKRHYHNIKKYIEEIFLSYDRYVELLKKEKLLDFSLLEKEFFELLNRNTNITTQYKYVFIDEFQDINPLQWKIFSTIVKRNDAFITVVGDRNQSIYGFRGSNPNIFDKFKEEFSEAVQMIININFRSKKEIVELANRIIDDDKFVLKPHRNENTKIYTLYDDYEEVAASKILTLIKKMKEKGIIDHYGQVALLFRSVKSHGDVFINLLNNEFKEIPYTIYGNTNFFENEEIRVIIYLMGYVLGATEKSRTHSLIWEITRFEKLDDVFETSFFEVDTELKEYDWGVFLDINEVPEVVPYHIAKFVVNLNMLKEDLKEKKSINLLGDVFYPILKILGINSRYGDKKDLPMLLNIGKFSELLLSFLDVYGKHDFKLFLETLKYLPDDVTIKLESDYIEANVCDQLLLMNIHQAKGLEFPIVIIPSLIEKRFPILRERTYLIDLPNSYFLYEPYEREKEEKNLFFVAVTRAQDLLILSYFGYVRNGCKRMRQSRYLYYLEDYSNINEEILNNIPKVINNTNDENDVFLEVELSSLITYLDCPERFKLNNIFGLKTEQIFEQKIGTIYHNAIAKINTYFQKKIEINDEIIDNVLEQVWIDLGRHNEVWRKKIKRGLKKYVKFLKQNVTEIVAFEKSTQLMNETFQIKGKCDLVYKDKKGYLVLADFKARERKTLDKIHVDFQLFTYRSALEREGIKIDKCAALPLLDDTEKLEPVEVSYDKKEFQNQLKNFLNDLKHYNFKFTRRSSGFCESCPYRIICRKFNGDWNGNS